LTKTFELLKGNPVSKELAHTVHDALRDTARMLPLSGNKHRAMSEKMGSGLILQEEAFNILDRLYKGYMNVQTQTKG
jgi:hypothetical protein